MPSSTSETEKSVTDENFYSKEVKENLTAIGVLGLMTSSRVTLLKNLPQASKLTLDEALALFVCVAEKVGCAHMQNNRSPASSLINIFLTDLDVVMRLAEYANMISVEKLQQAKFSENVIRLSKR
jgi:hypothetical protein